MQTKKLTITKGKNTAKETKQATSITLYPVFNRKGQIVHVSIPTR